MNALIETQQKNKGHIVLGLFGDMMQRIYGGGKEDLGTGLPNDWKKPVKIINYRSPKRVVSLINSIRSDIDNMKQEPKKDAIEGVVRLFIVDADKKDKYQVENKIKELMKNITGDKDWEEGERVKCLTLEHAMAAERGEFSEFFSPLAKNVGLRDSVLEGTSQEIIFIIDLVLPLVEAIENDKYFDIARIIKKGSGAISGNNPIFTNNPIGRLVELDQCVELLKSKLNSNSYNLCEVIKYLIDNGLLDAPDRLKMYVESDLSGFSDEDKEELDKELVAWNSALQANISSVVNYSDYIKDKSGFATHQGVKGLEFDRVMAVLDDESAGGFLFKYEKLLGAEPLSPRDMDNVNEGKDSAPLRTRRLFYVICSRAEKSLAVVAYTKNPDAVKQYATQSWFKEDEVVMFN